MAQVEFTESAQSDLARLDKPVAQRVLKKLRWLAENLEVVTPEAFTGQWQGVFKLRVGAYRVLYTNQRFGEAKDYCALCQASS
jgi:mRNA interferase RelE/StbE